MGRIVFGLILIVCGVLISTAKHKSPEDSKYMIIMAIFLMFIPGILFIKSGIVSISEKQKEKKKKEEERIRKEDSERKAKQMANCNHNFSSWSLKNVSPHYCGDYKVSKEGERTCIICSMIETCYDHDLQFVNSDGSLYDRTNYYRCSKCGYEYSIDYNI